MDIFSNDAETYPNLFVSCFIHIKTKERFSFIYWEEGDVIINQLKELYEFLEKNKDAYILGYNNLEFDGPLHTKIKDKLDTITTAEIKQLSNDIIDNKSEKLWENQLIYKPIDVMQINNYGIRSAKTTSLKTLKFNFRHKNLSDLPYSHTKRINSRKKVNEIIEYCFDDCETNIEMLRESRDLVKIRLELGEEWDINLLNTTEPKLVKEYFLKRFSLKMDKNPYEIRRLRTYHDKIELKDVIRDRIAINNIEEFISVYNHFKNTVLVPNAKSIINEGTRIIDLKKNKPKVIHLNGTEYVYGAGGIHGCIERGVYTANEDYVIEDFDKTSFYPLLQVFDGITVEHFPGQLYVDILYDTFKIRMGYSKLTHYILNYAYKIIINVVFGLSNSEYGLFYDPKTTIATTVNGMLSLTMHLDQILVKYPDVKVLQANTDGFTLMYPRKYMKDIHAIYDDMTERDRIPYELSYFKKIVINNVNNYFAVYDNGKTKSKGLFETYEDIIGKKEYHKDTSASIIPTALQRYFKDGVPVEETIYNCNNIFDFCYGDKGSDSFFWLLNEYDESTKTTTNKLFKHRHIRYYAGGNQTVSKLWVAGKQKDQIENVKKNTPITLALSIPKQEINDLYKDGSVKLRRNANNVWMVRYPNLDYTWYIDECNKIINQIEQIELT